MSRPGEEQMALTRHLLALEAGSGSLEQYAAAAARIYDKFHLGLDPILGTAGVKALFERSARLASSEFGGAPPVAFGEGSTPFQNWLVSVDVHVARQATELLFATFLGLLSSFIGQRLTLQLLKHAWPDIDSAQTPQAPAQNKSSKENE